MNFSLSFPAKYKGKFADVIRRKFKAFGWTIAVSVTLFVVSIIISFFMSDFEFGGGNRFTYGLVLFYVSILLFVCSPFVLLFSGINSGLSGQISMTFTSSENGECTLAVTATKFGKPFSTEARVNLIDMHPTYAQISTVGGRDYFVPLGQITDEQKGNLLLLERQIRNLRTVNSNK